jgi:glycosyltransferase involved in cell wall biosynthesis
VQSVLAQSHPAAEVVVVDDGSSDGGGDEVRSRFPNVQVIHQANAGVGAARNRGISLTRSPWIALLDADDYWSSNHLVELDRMVVRHPEAVLLSTSWRRVPHGSAEALEASDLGHIEVIDYFLRAARSGGPVWTSSAAFRRQAYEEVGGFGSARLGEDQEYWARLALSGPVVVSSAVTAAYVRGVDSVTETARRTNAPRKLPASGSDALPVLATVAKAMADGRDVISLASLHAYWNAKLGSKAREALALAEVDQARALANFMTPPYTRRERRIRLLVRTPSPVVQALIAARHSIRSLHVTPSR